MYFSASQELLQSEEILDFDVYLYLGNQYVLYAKKDQKYTSNLKEKLKDKDINSVYILTQQKPDFENYVERNFAKILNDKDASIETRSGLFYDTTIKNVKKFFQKNKLQVNNDFVERLDNLVRSSIDFLSQDEAIQNIGNLLSHDYKTYSHCMQVYTLSLALINKYDFSDDDKVKLGIGSLLHDMGKVKVPSSILNKPGKLNKEEWEYVKHHPVLGIGCCTKVNLSHVIINCILFHHEKCDGSGYPAGLKKQDIPTPVRILSICDIYDAITSNRPYAARETAQDALQIMNDEMGKGLDRSLFKGFVYLLQEMSFI